jgi:hypothetical protein
MQTISLGDMFELDQISTRAKTLSPTKSYAEKPYNWEEGDWWDLDDDSVGGTKILEDFEITDEMRRRPNAEGGRIALGDGTKFRGKGKIPPGFISRAELAKLLDIEPGTIMSSKLRGKKGGHGQTLYKNITDILKVKQSSSHAPEFYSKPTKAQIAKILVGTGKEGQQAKRPVYKGTKTMSSVIEKLLENTSKSLTTREIAEKITGKVPVNLTNHPVKKGVDYVLAERPDLKKKIKALESGTVKQMKFAPEKLEKLANLIEEGKGMKELMKETGMSDGSIYKFARLNNLKIIKTTPDQWENIKSAGNDITKLGKNKIITDALAGKTPLDSRLIKIADKIIGKGELNAARRLFNLAEFYTDGLSTPLKKNVNLSPNAAFIEGATKLRNTSSFLFDSKTKRTGYAFEEYIYKTNAKKIDKVLNLEPGSFLKMQQTFGKALPKGFSPDEIFGIRSSGRLGTEANALFVQGIPTQINTNDKRVADALKSFAEKRLQDARGNLTEQRKILTKYRTALLPYKKKYPKIEFPDFEIGKGGAPEKVIGPFERLPAKFKKLFKDQYKKFEYSPKVKKSVLTMFEALEKIKDPNFLTRMTQKAKMFPKNRIAVFPLIFGAGYLGLNAGDGSVEAAEPEIINTLEPSDKKQEASVLPAVIKDHPYLSSAAAVTAAVPKKTWEAVKWGAKKLTPLLTPAASHVLHGGKYDLTSGTDLMAPAFWKHGIDAMKAKSRWGNKQVGLMKRLRDIAWRGGLPTRFLPLISGTASAAMGPMLIKDAAEWLQSRIDKQGLTGMIADQSGIISDEAGGSLFMEDVVEEKKRKDAEGMDYAQGGIASLIK